MYRLKQCFALAAALTPLVLAVAVPGCGGGSGSGGGGGGGTTYGISGTVCSVDKWCWRNPLPQGNWLQGIWGSSASDVWAVGSGTIVHWNGSTWSSVPSGTTSPLNGVWGSGAGDAWAVGDSGTILQRLQ